MGQYYNRVFATDDVTVTALENAYLKKSNIAWFASHRHKAYPSENEVYQYSYLYKYELDIPLGAKKLILPENDKIKILSITAAQQNSNVNSLQALFGDFDYDVLPGLVK